MPSTAAPAILQLGTDKMQKECPHSFQGVEKAMRGMLNARSTWQMYLIGINIFFPTNPSGIKTQAFKTQGKHSYIRLIDTPWLCHGGYWQCTAQSKWEIDLFKRINLFLTNSQSSEKLLLWYIFSTNLQTSWKTVGSSTEMKIIENSNKIWVQTCMATGSIVDQSHEMCEQRGAEGSWTHHTKLDIYSLEF